MCTSFVYQAHDGDAPIYFGGRLLYLQKCCGRLTSSGPRLTASHRAASQASRHVTLWVDAWRTETGTQYLATLLFLVAAAMLQVRCPHPAHLHHARGLRFMLSACSPRLMTPLTHNVPSAC